jgi:hypothetical protein
MSLQELRYADPSTVEWMPEPADLAMGLAAAVWEAESYSQDSNWQERVDQRLKELSRLRSGWDGYAAEPPNGLVAAFASAVLQSVMGSTIPSPSIVPAHGGGLQLEWHTGGLDIELMIYRPFDAELSVSFNDGRDDIDDAPLTTNFRLLSEALEELA